MTDPCPGSHSRPRGGTPGLTVRCGWCECRFTVGMNNLLPAHPFTPDTATADHID